jgi:hypothetical protein
MVDSTNTITIAVHHLPDGHLFNVFLKVNSTIVKLKTKIARKKRFQTLHLHNYNLLAGNGEKIKSDKHRLTQDSKIFLRRKKSAPSLVRSFYKDQWSLYELDRVPDRYPFAYVQHLQNIKGLDFVEITIAGQFLIKFQFTPPTSGSLMKNLTPRHKSVQIIIQLLKTQHPFANSFKIEFRNEKQIAFTVDQTTLQESIETSETNCIVT